jgi:hypothetical protein
MPALSSLFHELTQDELNNRGHFKFVIVEAAHGFRSLKGEIALNLR